MRQRKEKLAVRHALAKRAPDQQNITVTETDTSLFATTTSTVTASPVTMVATGESLHFVSQFNPSTRRRSSR